MVMLSKELFNRYVTKELTCILFHPQTESCTIGALTVLKNGLIGINKFFIPIYLLQILLNSKRVNRKYIIIQLKAYRNTLLYGISYVLLFFTSNCFMRWLLNGYNYYSMALLCGFIAGLPIYIESPENRIMNTLLFGSLFVEAVIRNLDWNNIIKRTKSKETVIFMFGSGLLMYLFRIQKKYMLNFWFFHPSKNIARSNSNTPTETEHTDAKCVEKICAHPYDCFEFSVTEFIKYFGLGYVLEIVKFTVGNYSKILSKPSMIKSVALSRKNVLFGATIGGYVGLYRIISCFLLKLNGKDHECHSFIAGLLSGVTYLIKPNLQFLSLMLVTVIQLLIQRIRCYVPLSSHLIGILFATLNGLLLHNRFMLSETCPNYTKNMVTVCSNGLADKIYASLLNIFPSYVR